MLSGTLLKQFCSYLKSQFGHSWSMWTDQKDDKIFYLKCFCKRNCERGTKWKLQGKKKYYSFNLIYANYSDLIPTDKNELSHKF